MWEVRKEPLTTHSGVKFSLMFGARSALVAEVLQGWRDDRGFRSYFNDLLAELPFKAFRWETPKVTGDTLGDRFECVVLDDPWLARVPEPDAFAEHFQRSKEGVAVFPNMGGDAILIVPAKLGDDDWYGHLGAFVRGAPEPQRHSLWRAIGEELHARIGERPIWLSTAGAGVSWLHVRIDTRPKYYGFGPYRG